MDFKLTSLDQNGNGISTFGISDLFISDNYTIRNIVKLTVGVKIPFNKANKKYDGWPLPMDYQSSLGTFDMIMGFSFKIKRLQLVTALQYPLSQNKNEFIAGAGYHPIKLELGDFIATSGFKRSGDVLLRVSYPLTLNSTFKITPSLLPIYHLAKDKYIDELGYIHEIAGSDGLTLNVNVYLDYDISSKSALQLNFGAPLIVRKVRPDGLTRSFIGNLEYRFRF